jgi:hypothetical protein
MTEKDLIRKIKKLERIQPSQEWFIQTRHNLTVQIDFEKRKSKIDFGFGFLHWLREPHSVILSFCLLFIFITVPWLTIKASQSSLPGDLLYPVKKATEEIQAIVTSEESKAQLQVEFASRRLEELAKITEVDDFFPSEERGEKVKEVVNELRNNLAGATIYVHKITKEQAINTVKKTKKIKEDLDKTKEMVPSEAKKDIAEAEKAIDEINQKILTALTKTKDKQETETNATTTPDKEILIFLEEIEGGVTTTGKVINGVEEDIEK